MNVKTKYVVALLSAVACYAWADNPVRVEKPEVKVGDRYVYSQIDLWKNEKVSTDTREVVARSEDEIRVKTMDGSVASERIYDGQWNPRVVDGRKMTPDYPYMSFPLEVGKTWEATVTGPTRQPGGEFREEVKGTVVGWESVTVPAGTFNALKIRLDGYWNVVRQGRTISGASTGTMWYVPEVRRHIKRQRDDGYNKEGWELVEYQLK